jgi:hypothetical protein
MFSATTKKCIVDDCPRVTLVLWDVEWSVEVLCDEHSKRKLPEDTEWYDTDEGFWISQNLSEGETTDLGIPI